MKLIVTDGGREAAGFDCSTPVAGSVTRALAIILDRPYAEVHKALKRFAVDGDPDLGIQGSDEFDAYLAAQGLAKTTAMRRGEGTVVHLKEDELPNGRLLVQISHQFIAVIDGVQHNTRDWSRDGTRAVYAYWSK